MQKRLILMLSSGGRQRYRDDIIRALALPNGGRLQFRYRERYVPKEVFDQLSQNAVSGSEALIAYLDASNRGTPPEIVPCRFARVLDSEVEGEFAVIRFEVSDFAVTDQRVNLGSEASKLLTPHAALPHWESDGLKGHFLVALTRRPSGCQRHQDRRAWQAVVVNLGARADFHSCPFFYHLRTIIEENAQTPVFPSEAKYVLKPDKIYRAEIVHYTPPATAGQQGGPWGRLEVEAQGNGVQSLTTQHLSIDSPYDIKRVHFRTIGMITKQYALLSFGRYVSRSSATEETEYHDFELLLEVAGAWKRQLLVAGLIAVFLALPRWVDMLQGGAWDWSSAAVHLLTALVAAALVTFGLRKMP